MTRADFEAVRNPLLVLGVIVLGVAGAVYYTDQLALAARRDLAQQDKQLKDARSRLLRSGDEKDLIVRYLGSFQQLQKQGFAGEEQRINWLDALRTTNQQVDLFGVDYDIGTQKPYAFAAQTSQATTSFARSVSPASSKSRTNSLFAISTSVVLSTIGMSCSSSWVWRAERIGTAASLTVVQPMPA